MTTYRFMSPKCKWHALSHLPILFSLKTLKSSVWSIYQFLGMKLSCSCHISLCRCLINVCTTVDWCLRPSVSASISSSLVILRDYHVLVIELPEVLGWSADGEKPWLNECTHKWLWAHYWFLQTLLILCLQILCLLWSVLLCVCVEELQMEA